MLVALQLIGTAATPLNVTVLVPLEVAKFAPAIVTNVPTSPDGGFRLARVGGGRVVTVKFKPLLDWAPTVTTTFPVVAPVGTGTLMLVALQLVGVAATPLNVTVLVPCDEPKFAPAIATAVPTGPELGLKVVLLGGGGVTVKSIPLLFTPPTSTTTFPVVAPGGTVAMMLVPVQLVIEAAVPLKVTALIPWVAPKLDPAMVTDVPTGPEVGLKLATLGGGVTVKRVPLLATPPTVTTTFPVVAPTGTCAVILTELQAVGAIDPADVPLKVTMLVPWDEPKFAPEIKTKAPIAPDDELRLVTLGGGGSTVKFVALLTTPLTTTPRLPVVAPVGTVTWMLVSLQVAAVPADTPLNTTLLLPCVAPKFDPVIVTGAPTSPDVGLTLVIAGGGITVKFTPLLTTPPTVTTTGPVVAPFGTNVTMLVEVQLVAAAATPLNETPGAPWTDTKFAPVIVTELLTKPEAGFKLVMLGGGGVTVKATTLLATPLTVTTTFPVVAPVGTGTVMLVALQLVGVEAIPLNVTVLVPCVAPKLAPAMVTEAPTGPDVGLKEVMLGGRVPPPAALNAASKAPPLSEMDSVALTEAPPAAAWTASSAINFVLGDAGTRSSSVYPLPAVKVTPEAVVTSPKIRSPPTVVVAVPLFRVVPEPWAAEVTSRELEVVSPEYSRMAKRKVLFASDSETVTVLAPPPIFSA
jgi:hypothetical protein